MRFIAITESAAHELVSSRKLQSVEFQEGRSLLDLLCGADVVASEFSIRVSIKKTSVGLYLYTAHADERMIVFDLDSTGLFINSDILFSNLNNVQKICRFAIKYWGSGIPSPSEMIYPQYKRAVVFPNPISQKTKFRVCVDLDPDFERLSKRALGGRYLLIYKAGTSGDGGPQEAPPLASFRRFLDDVRGVEFEGRSTIEETGKIESLKDFQLVSEQGSMDLHQPYDTWLHALTDSQKAILKVGLDSPVRIEGPAGTGKTLSLCMKAYTDLQAAATSNQEFRGLFVAHSEATRSSIEAVLQCMGAGNFIDAARHSPQTIEIKTLQSACADILKENISETELLDSDAYDAKQMQLLYIEQAYSDVKGVAPQFEELFSDAFRQLLKDVDEWSLWQLIQHEIAVVIKGRAGESLDTYKQIPPIRNGLPASNEWDKAFLWKIYEAYRGQLVTNGLFDTDDVVLTALSQLTAPIWRRRRAREGFDALYVDETHLFNMNELSVFHQLTKSAAAPPIAFAVDRSQAVGDRGWNTSDISEAVVGGPDNVDSVNMKSVFRSSPEVVDLAFSITSSGASLFTNFDNPLDKADSNLSYSEEKKCKIPEYVSLVPGSLVSGSFDYADKLVSEMGSTKSRVAIIYFSSELFSQAIRHCESINKPVEILKDRGDYEVLRKADINNRFVLSMPEYVGGLEFDGVVLVGVDDGRLPPLSSNSNRESAAYLNYVAHNNLYVAVTRARYRVLMIGAEERGPSKVLDGAISKGTLTLVDQAS